MLIRRHRQKKLNCRHLSCMLCIDDSRTDGEDCATARETMRDEAEGGNAPIASHRPACVGACSVRHDSTAEDSNQCHRFKCGRQETAQGEEGNRDTQHTHMDEPSVGDAMGRANAIGASAGSCVCCSSEMG